MATATVPVRDSKGGKNCSTPAKPSRRKLRIREELLPESARYAEMDGREYVCIPVKDFGDWCEEIEDRLALREFKESGETVIPFDQVAEELGLPKP